MTNIVDAHVHLWDPDRLRYDWLNGSPLRRRIDADALRSAASGVSSFVLVQADCDPAQAVDEVEWLTEQAAELPGIRNIVAYAPLHLGRTAHAFVAELVEFPVVVGIRRLIQDEPPGFASDPEFRAGVALLAEFGLPFDLCVREHQLSETIELVRAVPKVQFVLDHLGKPRVGTDSEPWRRTLAELAALPNVVCKLSGLASEVAHGPASAEMLQPYLRHAVAVFGADRCLFGSDWPVMTLATSYEEWRLVVAEAVDPAHHDQVFHGTAERIYRNS